MSAAADWICDDYSLDIRYIAEESTKGPQIWQASIGIHPLEAPSDLSFSVCPINFRIGQVQRFPASKNELIDLLLHATNGAIDTPNGKLSLACERPHDFYSEMGSRERWFSELHLQVVGSHIPCASPMDLAAVDSALRSANPPFDGLSEAAMWLGFAPPGTTTRPPFIDIRVGPPCDLIFQKCSLLNDRLDITLHAHPNFDTRRVGLAVRGAPGVGLDGRKQVSDEIRWGNVRAGRRVGKARVKLKNADSALVMLMIGRSTVRRQWFLDPQKARNNRLLAVQHFDQDLKMIRSAVLETSDSARFEQGVAALLFLLGFSPCLQLETASPDLIVTTPGGRLVIVECTTRIADFSAKLGKLVDRRGSLTKSLSASRHPSEVVAVLVCRLPRDQIAAQVEELRSRSIILIAGEELVSGFNLVRHSNDPDEILDEAFSSLSTAQHSA